MADEFRFFKVNTGARIPSVGLGTYKAAPGVVGEAIVLAIKAGYRHIDCAQRYENEKEIQKLQLMDLISRKREIVPVRPFRCSFSALVNMLKIGVTLKKLFEDGIVKREDLWITSKLWCSDHAPEDVPLALNRTLNDLQLDYVDLYLMHWPVSMKKGSVELEAENLTKVDVPSTWRAMESLYHTGKARAIGVSNFSCKKLSDLLDTARIPPAVNQVECHTSWQQARLHELCRTRGVHLSGYSPLGSSGSTTAARGVLNNPILNTVAEKLGKTPAQVSLRWGLQMGHSVLPKSTNEKRIKENFDIFDWSIPQDLCAKFSEILQVRLTQGASFVHETFGSYKTLDELWDGEI